jgi:hypothetical protein
VTKKQPNGQIWSNGHFLNSPLFPIGARVPRVPNIARLKQPCPVPTPSQLLNFHPQPCFWGNMQKSHCLDKIQFTLRRDTCRVKQMKPWV